MEDNFVERIEKFLEDFMMDMYPKKDHYMARKYFRELFRKLVPKYFCICEEKEVKRVEIKKNRITGL